MDEEKKETAEETEKLPALIPREEKPEEAADAAENTETVKDGDNAPPDPPAKPTDPKKSRTAAKVASWIFSVLFCGVSLLYMAAQTAESAGNLLSGGADELLLGEVFVTVTKDGEVPDVTESPPPPDTESELQTDVGAGEDTAPPEPSGAEYESLANYDLLTDLSNETAYSPDLSKLLKNRCGVGKIRGIYEEFGDGAPAVLILHTHGTEAYSDGDTYSFRSDDTSKNVVAVGDVISKVLRYEGVNVIHCTEMFDLESYGDSYSKSYAAAFEYLEKYPSLSYVIDVHRDSVVRNGTTNIATYAECEDLISAQTMIVVGTDEGGAFHPNWKDNLSFALNVQENMAELNPTVPRKINLRCAAFNQALCAGSILVEIGSAGNTLTEAKRAAVIFALSFAEAVKGEPCSIGAEEAVGIFVP